MTDQATLQKMVKRPRGRPMVGAQLVEGRYEMTPEGIEVAAIRLEKHRTACRERYRMTQAILRRDKPGLFSKNGRRPNGRSNDSTLPEAERTLSDGISESPSESRLPVQS
jgi:hypothetical protein